MGGRSQAGLPEAERLASAPGQEPGTPGAGQPGAGQVVPLIPGRAAPARAPAAPLTAPQRSQTLASLLKTEGWNAMAEALKEHGASREEIATARLEYDKGGDWDPFRDALRWVQTCLRGESEARSALGAAVTLLQARLPEAPPLSTYPLATLPAEPSRWTTLPENAGGGHALLWRDASGMMRAAMPNPMSFDAIMALRDAGRLKPAEKLWVMALAAPLEAGHATGTSSAAVGGAGEGRARLLGILWDARRAEGVSDVHLFVPPAAGGGRRRYAKLEYRAFGQIVQRLADVPIDEYLEIQAALLSMAGRTAGDTEYATFDKQIEIPAEKGTGFNARLSMVPYHHNPGPVFYSTSIRLLGGAASRSLTLDQVLNENDRPRMRSLLSVDSGLVLVSGPTGSGKSTFLAALLGEMYRYRKGRRLISVEDPIELEIPGARQLEVQDRQGLTFAQIMRSLLRQDPDVVFVGEIRDEVVAGIAVQMAMAGQTVFATIHASFATTCAKRMVTLGASAEDLSIVLRASSSQRLFTGCCATCQPKRPLTESGLPGADVLATELKTLTVDVAGAEMGLGKLPDLVIEATDPDPDCPACKGRPAPRRLVVEDLRWEDLSEGGPHLPDVRWYDEALRKGGLVPIWFRAAALLLKGEISLSAFLDFCDLKPPRRNRISDESRALLGWRMLVESGLATSEAAPADARTAIQRHLGQA